MTEKGTVQIVWEGFETVWKKRIVEIEKDIWQG
jgi:hypothetical protein